MKRKEFVRCTPEEAGVSSQAVEHLLDHLEEDYTEIHSLMILRHDQVLCEGWWAPYGPGMKHMMMSASKTFTGTAIGIAIREGIVSLDEKIIDLFPEYLPENPSENLQKVCIRHLLSMSSGSDHEVPVDQNWPYNYFRETEFAYEPGTEFLYNNAPAALLAAVIRKKTGLSLPEYLKPRLFDLIGIDAENVKWFCAPNGDNFAPGGFHCTTEDLLRLMRLYLHHGSWDGVQILDEEYAALATSKQVSSENIFGYADPGRFSDNLFGYGYMMWISHGDMGYRAEGAYGQFGIVIPKLDMVIAVTQSSDESPVSQSTLDAIWAFTDTISQDVLEADPAAYAHLQNRLERLAIRRDPLSAEGSFPAGTVYTCEGRGNSPYSLFYDPLVYSREAEEMTGMTSFSFTPAAHRRHVTMNTVINGHCYELDIPYDGSRNVCDLPEMIYTSYVLVSGFFTAQNMFHVIFRWAETGFVKQLNFRFEDHCCTVTDEMIRGGDKDSRTTVYIAGTSAELRQ